MRPGANKRAHFNLRGRLAIVAGTLGLCSLALLGRAFALQVIGKPASTIRRVVPEVLDLVGLEGKGGRLPEELSGGEQQRVAIARAFVNRPMILIADEPTGNLDPTTSVGIMKLLDRINRTGTTVVMATHDSTIVDQMRKRVIELDDGEVVRDQSRGVYGYQ